MAGERLISAREDESLWKKSNAFKISVGMMVVGAIFSLSVAAIGLGVAAGSAFYWGRKKQ